MGADELSASLWRERRQLELLLFRLETQLLHLNADDLQWLPFTAADLESVLESLRFETLARHVEAAALAAEWGAPAEATLPVLAAAAPAGSWGALLQEHGHEMTGLLGRTRSAREANLGALASALEGITREAEAAAMSPEPADELALLAQRAAAERALAVVQDCAQPLVEEFLGLA
ncbi:conserved hypothetical protein [Arthrobacter sp. 9AX]|uniref:flagellar export chaperone FlgN n=1 Tax=Arthrobacter sp. 9AX TaxID=2653131 RepID=UPI0012F1D3ED|nr:flagellar protein FlgN [Arthrobacter sp. 9AX]VXB80144.1 conserved hypothetical protein [Arthrobacter sp. 9AX]